jgi:hypothetical protein
MEEQARRDAAEKALRDAEAERARQAEDAARSAAERARQRAEEEARKRAAEEEVRAADPKGDLPGVNADPLASDADRNAPPQPGQRNPFLLDNLFRSFER